MATSLRETAFDDASPPRRRLALVLNGKAGGLLAEGGDGESLHDLIEAAGLELVAIGDGKLPDRLAQALDKVRDDAADMVAVAGGDGSVACAAGILAGTGVKLGIIPCGTMNLLAKDLGIPPDDRAACLRILTEGTPRRIDMGEIGGHGFLCAAMLGSPARLGHHREEGRRRGNGLFGWLHFARAALRAARRHRALKLTVTIDGVPHKLRTLSLTITVNPLDEGTGRPFGRTCLDGGTLFLYVVQSRSLVGLLRLVLSTLLGRFGRDPSVRVLHGRTLELEGPGAALRVLIDGEEQLLATPLQARIKLGALTVLAP